MMIEPPINDLLKKADSRYSLVVAISKRARQLTDEAAAAAKLGNGECSKLGVGADAKKAVTVATKEINEDTIDCIRYGEVLRHS